MNRWRFAIYAGVILATVGGGVFFLAQEKLPGEPDIPIGQAPPGSAVPIPPVPPKPVWKNSDAMVREANAGFSVNLVDKSATALAGKEIGKDWPTFNGVKRDNQSAETGLLQKWPAGGPPRLWTAQGIGAGYSGISVVKGVIYTLTNKGSSESILALDAGTGEKLWCTPFGPATNPAVGPGPRGTPSIDAGFAYGLGADGELVCVETQSGKIQWQKNILKEFGASNIVWGICESVLIDGENLVCTPGGSKGTIVVLNKKTGELVWSCVTPQKDQAGYASAFVADVAGVRQYIQFTGSGTIGVAVADGKFLWRNDAANNGTANCSSPMISNDVVFSASNYGKGGALVKLEARDSGVEAQLVYETKDMKSHHGELVVKDGMIFGSNDPGILMCLDLMTGEKKWQNRSVGKGSVTYADGCIYLRSEAGPIALVKATGEKYEELGQFEQPNRSGSQAWTHPVVAAERLFIRDQDQLFCYDVKAR